MHDSRVKLPEGVNESQELDLTQISNQNNILGLRALLLNEIRELSKLDGKATKDRLAVAQVKCELSQTIINSVKVEVLYMQQIKRISATGFIPFVNSKKEIE